MSKSIEDTPTFEIFPSAGVLTRDDDNDYAQAILFAYATPDNLVVGMPGHAPVNFPSTDITGDQTTGRLKFISADTPYRIREFREDDGEWLSKYKTMLPLEALDALVGASKLGEDVATADIDVTAPAESLDAFSIDDSSYIVGLVYTNNAGRWLRADGDWILMAPSDSTFESMDVISIDPDRADEFLKLYDSSYVSISDAEAYEAPDQSEEVELEPDDSDIDE